MNEPKTFIVTVQTLDQNFTCDMELPSELPASELSGRLLDILRKVPDLPDADPQDPADPEKQLSPYIRKVRDKLRELPYKGFSGWRRCRLMFGNNMLADTDTLLKAGAFDGSRITLLEE